MRIVQYNVTAINDVISLRRHLFQELFSLVGDLVVTVVTFKRYFIPISGHVCLPVCVIVISLHSDSDCNKEAIKHTYLLT